MKILHLDSGREMRGGQWQALRLHRALLEAGHESLLFAREDGALLAMAKSRQLPCEPLGVIRVSTRSGHFDLTHAHDARAHTLAAVFSRCPFVVSRRVAFPVKTSAISRAKYRRARRYLAVSRFVAGLLIEAGIGESAIDVVYDGVELPPPAAPGDAIAGPLTLDPAKGMSLARDAAELAGVPIVWSSELERDLPRARALIYITHAEGLGSAILLAMAHGVPALATRTGGIPEIIEDGVNGILVENEPGVIANALRSLTPPRCLELGRAARETVAQRFTVARMAAATLESYRKALHD